MNLSIYDPKPERTKIGENAIDSAKEVLGKLKVGKKIGIVCDKITHYVAGSKLERNLKGYNFEYYDIESATVDEAYGVKKFIDHYKLDFIFGVGGGRPIDVAKLGSYLAKIDFASVPTVASHDGIASSRASLNGVSGKISTGAHAPVALFADTGIILRAPEIYYDAGLGDLFSNITAVMDWRLAYRKDKCTDYNPEIADASKFCANKVLSNPSKMKKFDQQSVEILVENLCASGKFMQAAGSSRPASGYEHKISHKLDELMEQPNLHGLNCALGSRISISLYRKLALITPDEFRNFADKYYQFEDILPRTAKDLNIPRDVMIDAVWGANDVNPDRYTVGNCISGYKKNEIEQLLSDFGIID